MKSELIFVPVPAIGHLVGMVEMAKLFISRHENLSVTVLIAKFFIDTGIDNYNKSLLAKPTPRLTIINLPEIDPQKYLLKPRCTICPSFIENQKTHVRDVMSRMTQSESTRVVGLLADILFVDIFDIADEFNVPTYVYSPAGAGFLGLAFHLQTLNDDKKQDVTEFRNSDTELLVVPSFANPVPADVLPSLFLDKEGRHDVLLSLYRRCRETKGIIVNTFEELEPYAINSLRMDSMIPPIYPVGPILNLNGEGQNSDEAAVILGWLDEQPPSSVVFLCFGSLGSFTENQVKEIAMGLERSGHRFLWSLRPCISEGETQLQLKYSNLELPAGFLDRTSCVGKVIGWAPQVAVLAHKAVGGFVSHCGWNSVLESVWNGLPVATWPMYGEQQLNAFEMVKELGLAVEIEVDYRNEYNKTGFIVKADEIDTKIKKLMMDGKNSEIRKKVKEMKEKSRIAMSENGSSYTSLAKLFEEIM